VIAPTFVQNLQHELRTPLAILLGYAELLCAGDLGELPAAQQQAVSVIAARAGRLHCLVEQIGMLLDTWTGAGTRAPLDLSGLVEQTARRWAAAAPDLQFDIHLARDMRIAGSAAHVRQALACLLDGILFYQADGGMNRCHTGCGLGLTLVKAVLQQHGGWLEIESAPGQGNCFALMLPAAGNLPKR
jgi:signal transduction histidine kinase